MPLARFVGEATGVTELNAGCLPWRTRGKTGRKARGQDEGSTGIRTPDKGPKESGKPAPEDEKEDD